MPVVSKSAASLVLHSEIVSKDEITYALEALPTRADARGDARFNPAGTPLGPAKRTVWKLSAERRQPGNLDAQIKEIFDQTTEDLARWHSLSESCHMILFCGLFLETFNEGIGIERPTLRMIADRKIELNFDIYCKD